MSQSYFSPRREDTRGSESTLSCSLDPALDSTAQATVEKSKPTTSKRAKQGKSASKSLSRKPTSRRDKKHRNASLVNTTNYTCGKRQSEVPPGTSSDSKRRRRDVDKKNAAKSKRSGNVTPNVYVPSAEALRNAARASSISFEKAKVESKPSLPPPGFRLRSYVPPSPPTSHANNVRVSIPKAPSEPRRQRVKLEVLGGLPQLQPSSSSGLATSSRHPTRPVLSSLCSVPLPLTTEKKNN